MRGYNGCLIEVPEKEKDKEAYTIFEEIMAKFLQTRWKNLIHTFKMSTILSRTNKKKFTQEIHHSKTKRNQRRKKNLKRREKNLDYLQEVRLTSDLSIEKWETEDKVKIISREMKSCI